MLFLNQIRAYSLLAIAIIYCLSSCNDNEPNMQEINEVHRTILVYMVANNSLGIQKYDISDINEMKECAKYNDFNNGRLLIYHAPNDQNPSLIEIKGDSFITIKQYDQTLSSVSSERMQTVINDTKLLAPAIDYGLILWSHGNGWLQTGIETTKSLQKQTSNTLAFGDDEGKHMNITTLTNIINDEGFSFIYFDCCYMATIEVAYELRNSTSYIIASTTEIPADGMPYEQNLPFLFENTPNLQKVCKNTFDYYNTQKGWAQSCAISLIDTKHLNELANKTASIYKTHPSLPANFSPQKFTLDTNCYYFDFGQYIEALCQHNENGYSAWKDAINKVVIYKAATPYMWNKLKLNFHSGLSTYILTDFSDSATKDYNQLQWWNNVASLLWQ